MNRDHLFKAWNGTEWSEPCCPFSDNSFVFPSGENVFCNDASVLKIVEFIGRKDKNGKEIYEGDIVKVLYTDWPSRTDDSISIEEYMDSIAMTGQIYYEGSGFHFMTKDRYGDSSLQSLHVGKHGFIKVIGNIYETPNLLN